MAFVEEEFRCQKGGEGGLAVDFLLEGAERLAAGLAIGAGQGDMGMKAAGLGNKSAKGSGCGDATGKGDECVTGRYIGKQDAGPIEEAQFAEMNWDRP